MSARVVWFFLTVPFIFFLVHFFWPVVVGFLCVHKLCLCCNGIMCLNCVQQHYKNKREKYKTKEEPFDFLKSSQNLFAGKPIARFTCAYTHIAWEPIKTEFSKNKSDKQLSWKTTIDWYLHKNVSCHRWNCNVLCTCYVCTHTHIL